MKIKFLAMAVLAAPALHAMGTVQKAEVLQRYNNVTTSAESVIGVVQAIQGRDEAAGKRVAAKSAELSAIREELEKNRAYFSTRSVETMEENLRSLQSRLMDLELRLAPGFSARSAFAPRQ